MANVLKAYVLYSAETLHVIPLSLLRRRKRPNIPNVIALEVNSSLCCDGEIPVVQQSATSKLKAYIMFGATGQALVGPVVRRTKPKGKGWRQIPYAYCCDILVSTPAITVQPAPQTVTAGQAASFSVTATGAEVTYQWMVDGVDIPGATGASYEVNPTVIGDNGKTYSVKITNAAGSVTSNTALLTVNPVPTTTTTSTSTSTSTSSSTTSTTTTGNP